MYHFNYELTIPILAVFGSLVVIPIIIFFVIRERVRAQNQQRLKEIEHGLAPRQAIEEREKNAPMRKTLLLMGVGIGLTLGYMLDTYTRMDELSYVAMLCLCIGLSRFLYLKKFKDQD